MSFLWCHLCSSLATSFKPQRKASRLSLASPKLGGSNSRRQCIHLWNDLPMGLRGEKPSLDELVGMTKEFNREAGIGFLARLNLYLSLALQSGGFEKWVEIQKKLTPE